MIIKFDEDSLIKYITLEISLPAIKYYIIQSIPGMYIYNAKANILISIVLIAFLLPAFIMSFKKNRVYTILSAFIATAVVLFQLVIFPQNFKAILLVLPKFYGMSIGCLIVSYNIENYFRLKEKLQKVSYIIILSANIEFITHKFFGVIGTETLNYDMSFGFFLVIPTAILFLHLYDLKGKKFIITTIFVLDAIIISTIMGSRGGVLALGTALFFVFFQKINWHNRKDILFVTISILIMGIILINYKEILLCINNYLISKNMNSRLIEMILSNNLTWSAGRDILWIKSRELIGEHPWIGNGMLSFTGAHNIFIELIVFYGIIFGGILGMFILWEWLKILFMKSGIKKNLMSIFLSYAIIDSMLNLTVIGKDIFWIYLGFALSASSKNLVIRKHMIEQKI